MTEVMGVKEHLNREIKHYEDAIILLYDARKNTSGDTYKHISTRIESSEMICKVLRDVADDVPLFSCQHSEGE
jgi:hypothetical protein